MAEVATLDYRELLAVYRTIRQPSQFLASALATGVVRSEASRIEFDSEDTEFGLAPFVRPCDEGLATQGNGWRTKWFRPAYIKMKDAINVCDNAPSWYQGERPYSRLTLQQRFDLQRARTILRHDRMLEERNEWMVAKLAVEGAYPITFQGPSGANLETIAVNFNRNPALNFTAAITWDQTNSRPIDDLETWFETHGDLADASPSVVICGRNVKRWLVRHDELNDNRYEHSRIRSQSFDLGRPQYQELGSARQWGDYQGVQYWSYTGQYVAQDGTKKDYIPANKMIIIAPPAEVPVMTRFYGAIKDLAALRAQEVFQKEWIEEDPSALQLLTQSAPMIGMLNENAISVATVL